MRGRKDAFVSQCSQRSWNLGRSRLNNQRGKYSVFLLATSSPSSSVAKLLPVPRKLRVGITNEHERGARLENGCVALEERGVDDRY